MHALLLLIALTADPKTVTYRIDEIEWLHVDNNPASWIVLWGHDRALWHDGTDVVCHGYLSVPDDGAWTQPQPHGRQWRFEFVRECVEQTHVIVIADRYCVTWATFDTEQAFRRLGGRYQDLTK